MVHGDPTSAWLVASGFFSRVLERWFAGKSTATRLFGMSIWLVCHAVLALVGIPYTVAWGLGVIATLVVWGLGRPVYMAWKAIEPQERSA